MAYLGILLGRTPERKPGGLPSCNDRNAMAVIEALREEIAARGLTDQVQVTGWWFWCLFDCICAAAIAPDSRHSGPGKCHGNCRVAHRKTISRLVGALFAINMLVGTPNGSSFSKQRYRQWLLTAGFTRVEHVALPGPNDLMIGHKA